MTSSLTNESRHCCTVTFIVLRCDGMGSVRYMKVLKVVDVYEKSISTTNKSARDDGTLPGGRLGTLIDCGIGLGRNRPLDCHRACDIVATAVH